MGERMSSELTRLLRERKLLRIRADRKLVLKEIKGASYDLRRARKSLDDDDGKFRGDQITEVGGMEFHQIWPMKRICEEL